jgi:hypothetical protein
MIIETGAEGDGLIDFSAFMAAAARRIEDDQVLKNEEAILQ